METGKHFRIDECSVAQTTLAGWYVMTRMIIIVIVTTTIAAAAATAAAGRTAATIATISVGIVMAVQQKTAVVFDYVDGAIIAATATQWRGGGG